MSMNKVYLLGHLGRKPEIKKKDDNCMVRFPLATNETYYDSKKEKQEKVEWHNIVAFGARAAACEKFLDKGSRVLVEGRLTTRRFEKDDQTRYITEVQVNDIQFLDFNESNE